MTKSIRKYKSWLMAGFMVLLMLAWLGAPASKGIGEMRRNRTVGRLDGASLSAEDVMNDQVIWPGVMTRSMACPPTCGAAAAVLVSEEFAKRKGLSAAVRIAAHISSVGGAQKSDRRSITVTLRA